MEKPAKVAWSRPAKNDLLDIFEAMETLIGPDRADALIGRIVAKSEYLVKFPEMGGIHHDVSSRYVKFR